MFHAACPSSQTLPPWRLQRAVKKCLQSAYACAAPSCPQFVVLSSTMATLGAFVSESRRQVARQNAAVADDDLPCIAALRPRIVN